MKRIATGLVVVGALIGTGAASADEPNLCRHQGTPHDGPNCPGHHGGTRGDPLHMPGTGRAPYFWRNGVLDADNGKDSSPCAAVKHWARRHESRGQHFYYVWAAPRGGDAEPMMLVCSVPHYIKHSSDGPSGDGASLPCPRFDEIDYQSRPADNGVGWAVRDAEKSFFGVPSIFTHLTGGWGWNRDGYWHYKFNNNDVPALYAVLYGFCRYWGPTEQERPR